METAKTMKICNPQKFLALWCLKAYANHMKGVKVMATISLQCYTG